MRNATRVTGLVGAVVNETGQGMEQFLLSVRHFSKSPKQVLIVQVLLPESLNGGGFGATCESKEEDSASILHTLMAAPAYPLYGEGRLVYSGNTNNTVINKYQCKHKLFLHIHTIS